MTAKPVNPLRGLAAAVVEQASRRAASSRVGLEAPGGFGRLLVEERASHEESKEAPVRIADAPVANASCPPPDLPLPAIIASADPRTACTVEDPVETHDEGDCGRGAAGPSDGAVRSNQRGRFIPAAERANDVAKAMAAGFAREPDPTTPERAEPPNDARPTLAVPGYVATYFSAVEADRQRSDLQRSEGAAPAPVDPIVSGDPTANRAHAGASAKRVLVMDLDPDALGPVRVRLEMSRQTLRMKLEAVRPETVRELQRSKPELGAVVATAGVVCEDIRVSAASPPDASGVGRADEFGQSGARAEQDARSGAEKEAAAVSQREKRDGQTSPRRRGDPARRRGLVL